MSKPQSRLLLTTLNLIGYVVLVVINALATTISLGGKTTGQLSDQYPNLFVPSGLTFSIWGVIYILLGIYVVYGFIRSIRQPKQANDFINRIGFLFIITCIANTGWILSWQYQVLPLSLVFMVILLLALILIYNQLHVGTMMAATSEKYLVHLPMSIYLGWITVATIANVTALLVAYKWNRFGISEQVWTVVMIAIALALGLTTLLYRRDIFYAAVVDWAMLGILIKRTSDTILRAQAVTIASIIGICLLTFGIFVQIARRKVYR